MNQKCFCFEITRLTENKLFIDLISVTHITRDLGLSAAMDGSFVFKQKARFVLLVILEGYRSWEAVELNLN